MSGVKGAALKAVKTMTEPSKLKVTSRRFTKSLVAPGKTAYPVSHSELEKLGFHFDRSDQSKDFPDTRPGAAAGATRKANQFHLQPASQAKSEAVKDYASHHGKHSVITSVWIYEDSTPEEVKDQMLEAVQKL